MYRLISKSTTDRHLLQTFKCSKQQTWTTAVVLAVTATFTVNKQEALWQWIS